MNRSIDAKLAILADAAKYDASCASSGSRREIAGGLGSTEGMGICHSYTPDGRCVSLLKILLTNVCIFDCQYCINRVSSDTPRARFTVDEVVKLTMDFYRRNYIEGLFLSSGIIRDSDYTMGQLVQVAKTLRERESYRGYIHLKTIPGAGEELIEEAGRYADRLSVNIELPTTQDLKTLAPDKKRPEIEDAMQNIKVRRDELESDRKKGMKAPKFAPAGQSTQMIVGATNTSDREILATTSHLYETHCLRRVYYSAFSPIPHADARLPGQSPPLIREHRLYQADWLIRFYGFEAEELTTTKSANLDLKMDPKLAWALQHRGQFPVDINRAARELLLRVPGIGEKGVRKIIRTRRHHSIRDEDLAKLGIVHRRARPFLITADRHPGPLTLDAESLDRRLRPKARRAARSEAMHHAAAEFFEDWRESARAFALAEIPPEQIRWIDGRARHADGQADLFGEDDSLPAPKSNRTLHVPSVFLATAKTISHHRDASRWDLLYRVLWRLQRGERHLMNVASDSDVLGMSQLEKAVRRDGHKMKAFVRFRKVVHDGEECYVAWHRPDHYALRYTAPFFARRFDVMRWTIMTPDETASWDGSELIFSPGMPKSAAATDDDVESLWKTYYAHIFNPARIKLKAMQAEMPKKHWATMPETELIDEMLREAPKRVEKMLSYSDGIRSATNFLPAERDIESLRVAAQNCSACELCDAATQTVFGAGPSNASLVLVGEQPGDEEDLSGSPFIGPAGRLLDNVLEDVGIDRQSTYITNAVKHFKFTRSGKRRLHKTPSSREAAACRPWLEAELEAIRPTHLVCLGATAAKAVFGPNFRLTRDRGKAMPTNHARWTIATYHPSAILRNPTASLREQFTEDMRRVAASLCDTTAS